MMPGRRARRALLATAIALLAVTAVLPAVRIPALAPPLKEALSRSLGLPVELGEVRCSVLPVPSLLAGNLVVSDSRAFGLEPLVYADEIRVSAGLGALARGALEPSAIRLTGASLNVARDEQAGFNVAAFLRRAFPAGGGPGRLPDISFRESRINFRSGAVKSVYYLNGVNLDLQPPREGGGELRWRYEASPARTDRAEQGFGRFTGSGRWIPDARGGRFAVDVALERSSVSELLVLLTGRDLGLQGRFLARAFLDGPFDALEIRGHLEAEELERPAFFGLRSRNVQFPFGGLLNLDGQTLRLSSRAPERGGAAAPLDVRLEGRGLMTTTQWRAELSFHEVPLGALLDLCRRLGIETPEGLHVEGTGTGSASLATGSAARGQLQVAGAQLRVGEGPAVEASEAALRLEGNLLTLEGARITTPKKAEAQVSGTWDLAEQRLAFDLRTDGMEIEELNGALQALAPLERPPLLRGCKAGRWRGRLGHSRRIAEAPGGSRAGWTGKSVLSGAQCAAPGLPASVSLREAQLELAGEGWRLRESEAILGGVPIGLEARFEPEARPPLLVSIRAERLEGRQLDEAFRIAQPPPRSLLDRTLRRRATMPGWLRQLHLEGTLRAKALVLGRQEFEDVEARFHWRAAQVRFDAVEARWKGGTVQGTAAAALWREEPEYRIRAVVTDVAAGAGTVDAELEAVTPALGAGLAEKARGWAEAGSPLLRLPAGGSLRHVHVSLEYDGSRTQQPWRVPEAGFWMDGQFWSGRGTASEEGAVRLEMSGAGASWEGTLWPPSLARAGR